MKELEKLQVYLLSRLGIKERAFSFIEMLIVIVIISIVSSVTLISYEQVFSRNVEFEAKKIVNDIVLSREIALAQRKDLCIRFNAGFYDIFENSCGANFLRRENIESTITAPSLPFDIIWNKVESFPLKMGGAATSTASVNGELLLTLIQRGKSKSIRIFEDTGYAKIE